VVRTTPFFILSSAISLEILGITVETPIGGPIVYFAAKGYNKAKLIMASVAASMKRFDNQKEEKEKEEARIKQAYQEGINEGMRRANGHNGESK